MKSQMRWLEMASQAGVLPVPVPVADRDGKYVNMIRPKGAGRTYHCAVLAWIHGEPIANVPTEKNYYEYGSTVARFHEYTAVAPQPADLTIPTEAGCARGDAKAFERRMASLLPQLPKKLHGLLAKATEQVVAAFASLRASRSELQILHGDLHAGNAVA